MNNLHYYFLFDVINILEHSEIILDYRDVKFNKLCYKIKKTLGVSKKACIDCKKIVKNIINNIKEIKIKNNILILNNKIVNQNNKKNKIKNKKIYKKYFYNLELDNFDYHHIIPRSFAFNNEKLRNKLNSYLNVLYIRNDIHVLIHKYKFYIIDKITNKKIVLKGPLDELPPLN